MGAREREGLNECGSEDEPTLQKRKAGDQERKLKTGSGRKKYPIKKLGTNVLKEIK